MVGWEELEQACQKCQKCSLASTREKVVFGVGNKNADLLFVGEGPGFYEDKSGEPFVGAAGQLLDKMLSAIQLKRQDVYIANIVKCRPPQNRDPLPEEQAACLPYLRAQFVLIKPKMTVCLGRVAAQALIDKQFKITQQRGQWVEKKGIFMMATYHPSALLRDDTKKRSAWEDFKNIKLKYEEMR